MTRTAESAPLPCARAVTRAPSCDGNAPDPLFSGGRRHAHFTRAAEQCHVSQPALTRAIQQLEGELGGLLLRRERKLTHLTDFGRLIEPHLRQMLTDAEAAKSTARKFLSLQQAQIRPGVMCTI